MWKHSGLAFCLALVASSFAVGQQVVEVRGRHELGVRLAKSAEGIVQSRFSAHAMASQVEAIYEQCLHPRPHP